MDRNIKIVRQLEQVFESYSVMFKGLKGENMLLPSQCFCKEKKNTKKEKQGDLGGSFQLFEGFRYWRGVLEINSRAKGGISVFSWLTVLRVLI
jgi:hypothetical protein